MDENINLKFPSMIWGGFHGWEVRITGWAGVEVCLRVLQTPEGQRFSSDACMAGEGRHLDYVVDLQILTEHAQRYSLKPSPNTRLHVSGSVQNQQIWHGHS